MKISFKNKILFGYISNLIVVLAIWFIYWNRVMNTITKLWDWISLAL